MGMKSRFADRYREVIKGNIKIITVKNEGSLLTMKNRRMRLMAIFAASVLSVTSMGGIVTVHAGEALAVPADEAGVVQTDGKDVQAAEDGSVAASEGLIAESFKPSEIAQPAQDTYEYPFLGMKLGISKDLKEQMEKKNISMFTDERWNDNADAVTYATASWCTLTDEQKDAEVDKMGTGYDDWLKSLSRVGVIGMYDEESHGQNGLCLLCHCL